MKVRLLAAVAAAFSSIFVFGGCTFKEMAYRNADFFILGRLDDAFRLSKAQEKALKQDIASALAWHKKHELPFYVQTLSEIVLKVEDGVTATEVDWIYDKLNEARNRSLGHIYNGAGRFFSLLSVDNLQQLQKYQTENNKKRFADLLELSEEDFAKKTKSKTIAGLENWVGKLTTEQTLFVQEFASRWRPLALANHAQVLNGQSLFQNIAYGYLEKRNILASPEDSDVSSASVSGREIRLSEDLWKLTLPMLPKDSPYAARRRELFVRIAETLTPAQIKKLKESIQDWQKSFENLIKDP